MSKDVISIVAIVSFVVWITVSQEAVKPSKEINWRKMITLLSVGTLLTLVITISLFQCLILTLIIHSNSKTSILMMAKPTEAAGRKSLDSNWKYRVDPPLSDGGKENEFHVHVKGKVGSKTVEGSETVTGKISHKTTLDKAGVPKWVQKDVKKTADFKKGVTKQKELKKAKNKAKKFSWTDLIFDPAPIIVIAVIIGVSFILIV